MNLGFPRLRHTGVTLCSGLQSTLAFAKPPHTSLSTPSYSMVLFPQNAFNHIFLFPPISSGHLWSTHKCPNLTSSSPHSPKAGKGDWGQLIFPPLLPNPCTWFPKLGFTTIPHPPCVSPSSPWLISFVRVPGLAQDLGTAGKSSAWKKPRLKTVSWWAVISQAGKRLYAGGVRHCPYSEAT